MERIRAGDGDTIVLHSTGSGPGIVVVHGGGVTIGIYRRLAARLADRFTVHLYNRRGREDAAPRKEPYTFDQDIDDLAVILEHTGARAVIGHSSGAFIALQAALGLPIDRLALYDAAVSIDGGFPTAWLDAARVAARDGDIARSMAITTGGINTHSLSSRLPLGVRVAICRAFLRTSIGRTMGGLLPTTLDESNQIRLHDGPAETWSGIRADVLLTYGASGPGYYAGLNEALAGALPRARVLPIPRSGHDGLNRAPDRLVEPLAEFFAAPAVSGNSPTTRPT
jgi:pimeloyl-ACP methyl ester carboxylesterase